MKITLNFAAAESSRDHNVLAWAIPATIVGLTGLLWLGLALKRELGQYRVIQRQAADYQQHEDQLRRREVALRQQIASPEYRDLMGKVQFMNSLINQRRLSLSEIVKEVGRILPDDAHLTRLELLSQDENLVIRFSIKAKSEKALETFMSGLEDSPSFQDVTIANQGFQEAGAEPGQVIVTCLANYLPGAHD
jgi:Tfp pilus assembly protein PilN